MDGPVDMRMLEEEDELYDPKEDEEEQD